MNLCPKRNEEGGREEIEREMRDREGRKGRDTHVHAQTPSEI